MLAPERDQVELYRGLAMLLHARCEAGPGARVRAIRATLDGALLGAVEQDELRLEHGFEHLGSYQVELVCSDDRGASTRLQVHVTVQSEPPYVVYHDPVQLRAVRLDRLERSEVIEPERPLVAPEISELHYARGGEAVVTVARLERSAQQAFAIYLDDPAQPQRFELGRKEHGWLQLTARVSPDGRYAVVFEQDRAPRIHRLDDAGPVAIDVAALAAPILEQGLVEFAPDGRHLLYGAGGPLQLCDLQTGATVTLARGIQANEPSWGIARFVDDGQRVVYALFEQNGAARIQVIARDAALAGAAPTEIAVVPGFASLYPGTERTLLIAARGAEPDTQQLTALDLAGNVLASYRADALAASCGDRVLVERTAGSLELVTHEPMVAATALVLPRARDGMALWSSDCTTLAYEAAGDVLYFELPAAGLPPAAPLVHVAAGQRLREIAGRGASTHVVTFGEDGGESYQQLNRAGAAVARLPSAVRLSLLPDGSSVVWMRAESDPLEPSTLLLRTALAGMNAGSSERLYGPFDSLSPPLLAPDGRSLLLHARQGLSAQGELIGDSGLVRLDLDAPNGPGSGPLLPYVRVYRAGVAAERIAGRRALLLTVPGEVPGVSKPYVRALEDGAVTVEQALSGLPRVFTRMHRLSPDGGALAVQIRMQGQEQHVVTSLRTRASDPIELLSQPARPDESLLGFGARSSELVLGRGGFDDATGGDVLLRRDLVAGQTRIVAQPPGATQELAGMVSVPDGRLFFQQVDSADGSAVLYLDEPGNLAPRALSPQDRTVSELWIAPRGDWLALRLRARSGELEPLRVLDARRDWQSTALGWSLDEQDSEVSFVSGANGDQLLVAQRSTGAPIRRAARDSLDAPRRHPFPNRMRGPFVSPDQTRALAIVRGPPGPRVATLDLRAPDAEPQLRAGLPWPNTRVAAISASGRYLIVREERGSGGVALLDVDAERVYELPVRTQSASFDRLGRYLLFVTDDVSCDIQIVDLAAPDQPPRIVPRGCPALPPLWVD